MNVLYKPEQTLSLSKWLNKPAGASLLKLECHTVGSIAATLFGYDTVILGEPEFIACLQQSNIKRKYLISVGDGPRAVPDTTTHTIPYISSRHDKLPINSESVDLVYIAHSLEYSNNPYEVLLEAYRILRPDGHLIISMFNPFSLLGMWRHLAKWGRNSHWKANFMSSVKLKDWLGLLGFDIMRVNHFGYYLPEIALLEKYGKKLNIPLGASYVIEAGKKVIALTPMKPVWSSATEIAENDLTEPTT